MKRSPALTGDITPFIISFRIHYPFWPFGGNQGRFCLPPALHRTAPTSTLFRVPIARRCGRQTCWSAPRSDQSEVTNVSSQIGEFIIVYLIPGQTASLYLHKG